MQVTIMAVQAKVEKLTSLTVMWTRGQQRCETNMKRVNPYSSIIQFNETFTRDCQFFKSGEEYTEKMCNFYLKEWHTDGKADVIGQNSLNMAPYVNKLNEKVKVKFPGSKYPESELLISISISNPETLRKNQLMLAEQAKNERAAVIVVAPDDSN